jgi:hypothetical protein
MMGSRQVEQGALFYNFSIDAHVPADHLLRSIDRFVDLSELRPSRRSTARWDNPGGLISLREQANELGAGTAVLRSSANNRRISKEKRQEKMKNIFPGLLFGCPCALATLS